MASANFTNLPRALIKGDLDFDTLTAKVMLLSAVPTEAQLDSWVNRSDVLTEIGDGSGYTLGGIGQSFTLEALDTANNRQAVTYANQLPGWSGSNTFTALAAIIYKDSGSPSTDTLMHMIDFGGAVSCVAGVFNLTYSAPFIINR